MSQAAHWEVVTLVLLGLTPLLAFPLGRRRVAWLLISLIPLHQYLKSYFLTIEVGSTEVQWPTLGKDVAYLILFVATLLVWLLKARRRLCKWLVVLVSIAGGLSFMSMVLGSGLGQTVMGLRVYLFWPTMGILVGGLLFREVADVRLFVRLLLIGALCLAVISLIQAYVHPRFMVHEAMRQLWAGELVEWFTFRDRLRGVFTSANTLALFMGLGLVCCTVEILAPSPRDGRWAVVAFLVIPAFVWVLFLTESRTAMVSCLAALGVLGMRPGASAGKRLLLIGSALAAVGTGYLAGLQTRFVGLLANPRLIYWAAFLAAAVATPTSFLAGQGLGAIGRYGVETQASIDPSASLEGVIGGAGMFFVDSVYIRSLYEIGVLGLVPFIFLALQAARMMTRSRSSPAQNWSNDVRATLLTYLLVASILTETLLTYPWNLLGWMVAIGNQYQDTQADRELRGRDSLQTASVVP